ncbi:hypothetical protein [Streptomyces noursei]|nr:hypothetical protein [Streptomyces noursei]
MVPDNTPAAAVLAVPDGHVLLIVRHHRYTRELTFYRCHSTTPSALRIS